MSMGVFNGNGGDILQEEIKRIIEEEYIKPLKEEIKEYYIKPLYEELIRVPDYCCFAAYSDTKYDIKAGSPVHFPGLIAVNNISYLTNPERYWLEAGKTYLLMAQVRLWVGIQMWLNYKFYDYTHNKWL